MSVDIESSANRRIIETARLKDRRHRDSAGRFLVEGTREIERAEQAGASIDETFLCPEYAPPATVSLAERIAGVDNRLTTVSAIALDKLTMRQSPDGIIAIDRRARESWTTLLFAIHGVIHCTGIAIVTEGCTLVATRTCEVAMSEMRRQGCLTDPDGVEVFRVVRWDVTHVNLDWTGECS